MQYLNDTVLGGGEMQLIIHLRTCHVYQFKIKNFTQIINKGRTQAPYIILNTCTCIVNSYISMNHYRYLYVCVCLCVHNMCVYNMYVHVCARVCVGVCGCVWACVCVGVCLHVQ